MTWDQIAGLLRQILPFVGGFAIARGWLNTEQVAGITGAVVTLGGVLWSIKANSKGSIIASATKMPEVDSNKLAAAISDPALKQVAQS